MPNMVFTVICAQYYEELLEDKIVEHTLTPSNNFVFFLYPAAPGNERPL